MSILRIYIDASALEPNLCSQVHDFILTHMEPPSGAADLSNPGAYTAYIDDSDLSILNDPILKKCKITRISGNTAQF